MKEWQTPITTRRYLHGPLSERIVTLWSEGKVVLGEVEILDGPSMPDYETLISAGIWPVFGKDLQSLDFKTTENIMMPNGIPIHAVSNTYGGLGVTVEAFCDTQRKSTAFVRMSVKNRTDAKLTEQVGFLIRTGLERELVFDAPDVYKSYAPDVNVWKSTAATWKKADCGYRDGEYFLTDSCGFGFDRERGLLYTEVSLESGEETAFELMLGKGEVPTASYDVQKQTVISFWENELKRITRLPEGILNDDAKHNLVNNLAIQLLQCFTKPVGTDYALCRQGGLQRRIWTYEALYALEALDKIGNFDDYIEPALDLYFNGMQADDGEIVPLGIYWASASATSLYSFADHAIRAGREYFEKYREKAVRAFEFIKRTRASAKASEYVTEGLYPPKRSCDCDLVLQAWTFTDTINCNGIGKFAEALRYFGDPLADTVTAEVDSYTAVIGKCFERAKELSDPEDGIRLTSFVPGMPGDDTKFAFSPCAGILSYILKLKDSDVDGLIKYMKNHDRIHEGLYWRMPEHYYRVDADGIVRMWYTTLEEFYWFDTFLRLGRRKEADEVLESTLRYSVTAEGYMVERMHQRDPYFCPWSPNASANGRLIMMLLASMGKD